MASPKQLTYAGFTALAKAYGIEPAQACAIMLKESKAKSFDDQGRPYILFERHQFFRSLERILGRAKAVETSRSNPSLCNASPTAAGDYGTSSAQWGKFSVAQSINRIAAIESCSWGAGQVMGYHWKLLGYSSAQDMVNAMFKSEVAQVEAIFRYLKENNLISALNAGRVDEVARGYNGVNYAKTGYDKDLDALIKKCKGLLANDRLGTLEVFQ